MIHHEVIVSIFIAFWRGKKAEKKIIYMYFFTMWSTVLFIFSYILIEFSPIIFQAIVLLINLGQAPKSKAHSDGCTPYIPKTFQSNIIKRQGYS